MTTRILQAGERFRLRNGLERCGNESGPLREMPDYSYIDGSPGPLSEGAIRQIRKREKIYERIKMLAAAADSAARAAKLPEKPGIRKHRKKDVNFFYEGVVKEDKIDEMIKFKKIPM